MTTDYLIRGTGLDQKVRVIAASTKQIVEELRLKHYTLPTATAALGRTATAAVMMGAMLKGDEKLTLQIKGDGPLGTIVADANAKGEVRAYVDHPDVHFPPNEKGKLDVSCAVGKQGYIHVIKDLGLKEPYHGSVPIVSGEIGDDITYYFAYSEQTPSSVGLGVLVDTDGSVIVSGGFIFQVLPGIEEHELDELERRIQELPPITQLLSEGSSIEAIVEKVLPDYATLERTNLSYRCKCSKQGVEHMLLSLGKEQLETILKEDQKAEVVCHFCNETYHFNKDELSQMVNA